jgi:hypothetical protein
VVVEVSVMSGMRELSLRRAHKENNNKLLEKCERLRIEEKEV